MSERIIVNIEKLTTQLSTLDSDIIVNIAYKPSFAYTETVSGLAVTDGVLYLAGAGSTIYLPAKAAELLDWSTGEGRITRELGRKLYQNYGL